MPESVSPIAAVIFDWAGTLVDYGSCAPAEVFVRSFAEFDVAITRAQVRQFMGRHKRDHTAGIARLPKVEEQWRERHGRPFSEEDIDAIYARSLPLQQELLPEFARPISGVLDVFAELRGRGIKTGSTTGYVREMMDTLVPAAAGHGLTVDAVVCSDEVPTARPSPFMALENLVRLGCWPVWACVKVGDNIVDMEEGRNAGMWCVGVSTSGNMVGLTEAEWSALPPEHQGRLREDVEARLTAAGAHFVVERVGDLLPVLDQIEGRLRDGKTPPLGRVGSPGGFP